MPDFMNRYYKRKTIILDCEVVTPMFLGNASGAAEWRAEPFKALFRAWWRVTRHRSAGEKALFHEEAGIFGAAGDEESSCKSLFSVAAFSGARAVNTSLKEDLPKVHHEECEKQNKKVDPLLYLAGMGILMPGNKIRQGRSYFPPGSLFTLTLTYPCNLDEEIRKVIALIQAFGAVGGRCRNGWGSFLVKNPVVDIADAVKLLCDFTKDWQTCMTRDYPNAMGKDQKGPLLWKSESMKTWEEALAILAKAYIKVRVDSVKGFGKLNPGENYPPRDSEKTYLYEERHLLGIPLTSHPKTGGDSRHASPLRFFVKKQVDGFTGFILHVPHDHSKKQKLANGVTAEKVWEKVHKKLDAQTPAITRAEYKEVLV